MSKKRKKTGKGTKKNRTSKRSGRGEIVDMGGQPFHVVDLPGGGMSAVNLELLERLSHLEPPDPSKQRWLNKWTTEDDLKCEPWFCCDDEGNQVESHASALATLARAGEHAGEVWLWCLHCERFFQAKHLKLDFLGNWQRCPFDDCRAAGLDVDILTWDACRRLGPPGPESEQQLRFGLKVPPWPGEPEAS